MFMYVIPDSKLRDDDFAVNFIYLYFFSVKRKVDHSYSRRPSYFYKIANSVPYKF
jgi:hypothetical protein